MGLRALSLSAALAAITLIGCAETTRERIKKEGEHFEFLVMNDASKQEKCASMKRMRNLNAEAKDSRSYRFWSDQIKRDC